MQAELRAFPQPYKAALAICSDLDETPDRQTYFDICRFLNTTCDTTMGPGVGLEVGNSIYFDMPPNQFAYWTTDDVGREMVCRLIQSGHIDCLHSYGDFARTRADCERNIEELRRHRCRLEVWVDHSKAPSNFGPDIMCGRGDVAGDPVYHADLTRAYGIRYVWRGRTTSILGQDRPLYAGAFSRLFHARHPLSSARNVAKQSAKVVLGKLGSPKWEMYGTNRVCQPAALRDGERVWEFMRSNPHWAGPGEGDTASGVADVLSPRMLEQLVDRGGACILYTHLGKVPDPRWPFDERTTQAFRQLAEAARCGKLFVTTTHRLLRFLNVRDSLLYSAERVGEATIIRAEAIDDPIFGPRPAEPAELMGLTFIVDRSEIVEVVAADGQPASCEIQHYGDRTMVSVSWKWLEFPAV